ncbi:MAG: metal ABC transporter permease [Actinomycetota bacterium]
MSPQVEIVLIAAVVAAACALPGVFLVLRRMAMMSDAISHTVLLGIVTGYLLVSDLDSPLLLVGAAAMGILTVTLVEVVTRTKLVKEDAAIGIVFPGLFGLAVLLISVSARDVHLDEHVVFQGDLVFAPFDRLVVGGVDLGPRTLITMAVILVLNLTVISLFYKELKIATFDPGLAAALGFSPILIHYLLMTMVSVTAVGAFDAVGSILVVALMVVPSATAYLITNRLSWMIGLSIAIGVFGAVVGFWLARWLDTTIGGSMVATIGLVFGAAFLCAPERGIVAITRRRLRQRWEFAQTMLAIHLLHHEGTPEAVIENRVDHLWEELRWKPDFAEQVVRHAEQRGVVRRTAGMLSLTGEGRELAEEALINS